MNAVTALQLAMALATDAPHLLKDFVVLWHDLVHGKGGLGKIVAAVDDAAAIATDVAKDAGPLPAQQESK